VPLYVIWIVAIVVAVSRWSRHPRVSLFCVIGVSVLFVQTLLSSLLTPWLQMTLTRGGLRASRLGLVMGGISLLVSLIRATAWGLLIAAIFIARNEAGSQATEA
jgi:hypothetical protein